MRSSRTTSKSPPSLPNRTQTIKFSADSFVARYGGKSVDFESVSFEDVYEVSFEEDKIEEGDRSTIFKCRHRESREERAVKRIEKSRWNEDENEKIHKEVQLLRSMDHPNIIKIYAIFEDDKYIYIVMEYCSGGELYAHMFRGSGFSEYYTAVLIKTLLSTVNYFYSKKKVVHLGIKPENILLESHGQIELLKIIDFGNSIIAPKAMQMNSLIGNPQYLAPESAKSNKYSHKTDIWAIGVLMFASLSGTLPFDASNHAETLELIVNSKEDVATRKLFTGPGWEAVSDDAIDLLSQLLSYEQFKRPSAKVALSHPWIERVTEAQSEVMQKRDAAVANLALNNLFQFSASSKLQQAALTYISSQLLTKFDTASFDNFFQAMDISGAGKLTKDDLKKSYSKFLGEELSESEVDGLFEALDVNSSNFVEYTEWLVAALPEAVLLSEANLKKTFDAFDKDLDGNISAEDLKHVLRVFLNIGDESVDIYIREKILEQVKTGEDGKLTYAVFVDMLRETKNGPGRDLKATEDKNLEKGEEDLSVARENLFEKHKLAFERNLFDKYKLAFERKSSKAKVGE